MVEMEVRNLAVGQYQVQYREWTRREVKGLGNEELDDFMVNEVIRSVMVGDEEVDPDDLPIGDLLAIISAIGEGLAPNGRTGSARRQQIHRA